MRGDDGLAGEYGQHGCAGIGDRQLGRGGVSEDKIGGAATVVEAGDEGAGHSGKIGNDQHRRAIF